MSDVNIIVVDDEPGLRGMMEDYLSMQGLTVASAENGAALDRLLSTHSPDLLLMDCEHARRRRHFHRQAAQECRGAHGHHHAHGEFRREQQGNRPFERRRRLPDQSRSRCANCWRGCAAFSAACRHARRRAPRSGRSWNSVRLRSTWTAVASSVPRDPRSRCPGMDFDLLETFARHPRQILSRDRLCELAFGRPLAPADRKPRYPYRPAVEEDRDRSVVSARAQDCAGARATSSSPRAEPADMGYAYSSRWIG